MFSKILITAAAASLLWCKSVSSQTYSSCNPLYTTGCPPNTALGKSINVDFTKGEVNSFTPAGNPTYDSDGAHFTVSSPGAAPQLISVFYIMFGRVEISMKAAPGAGIVSSLVLQSDSLDEIDIEWLGADDSEMQTNYFGKGDVTTYNRGAFHSNPNNQGEFITYTIDWTATQITWSIGGNVVRVLTPDTADANQYPQTPMQVKFGSWSGGDSSNAPGTIEWSRGPTDYSKGPFTMSVRSLAVTDYSTGTQYKYGDTSGNWGSIIAVDGKVNGNLGGAGTPVATANVPAVTSASPSIPAGGIGSDHGDTSTRTGWPWVAGSTTLSTATSAVTSAPGLPSGWVISSSGKIVPASSAATMPVSTRSSLPAPSRSQSSQPLSGYEVITAWDDRGFPVTRTVQSGWETIPKSFDDQGFLITGTAASHAAAAGITATPAVCFGVACGAAGKVVGTSTSKAQAEKDTPIWGRVAMMGLAAAFVDGLLH